MLSDAEVVAYIGDTEAEQFAVEPQPVLLAVHVDADVAKSADLPAERGQQFVEEVTQRAEAARKDLEQKIHQVVNDRLASMKPARQDEVDQLKTRVDALERKFGAAAD